MANDSQAALAALAYAAYNEQDGYIFYSRIAEHIRDEKGRRMIIGLASDEVKHYQLLVAEYESLKNSGFWLPLDLAMSTEVPPIDTFRAEVESTPDAAIPNERLFPKPEAVIPALDAGIGDLQAIDMALEAEKRGYDLYSKAEQQASDPGAKAVYRLLMQEESKHYEWLQKSRSYLAHSQTYWDETELPFFEG